MPVTRPVAASPAPPEHTGRGVMEALSVESAAWVRAARAGATPGIRGATPTGLRPVPGRNAARAGEVPPPAPRPLSAVPPAYG